MPEPAAISVFTAVVIIACPCALTIAAPFALGAAAGVLGRNKFYVREPRVVLDLTTLNTIVFDKTGTLTDSKNTVVSFTGNRVLSRSQRQMLIRVLRESTHPLCRAITSDYTQNNEFEISEVSEFAGKGVQAVLNGTQVRCGSAEFAGADAVSSAGSMVYCSFDGEYVGYFEIYHPYKSGLQKLLWKLQRDFKTFLLSGDTRRESAELEEIFGGNDSMQFEQSPHQKTGFVEKLQNSGNRVMMIGDGLNDAGALRQSDVGVAITSETAAFTPACDVIADDSTLAKLPEIVRFSRFTKRVIIGVFFITVLYNAIGLTLAVTNSLSPLAAAILMPASSLTVIACSTFSVRLGAKWMSYFS
jgi:Cu+-exporting ATPase